jgi:hypothetical protein
MTTGDARRAALTIHALPAADREWMMQRLDLPQRRTMEVLLGELDSLGVVADARMVEQALAAVTEPKAEPVWHWTLAGCDADTMLACLKDEPAMLVARVLERGPWPWDSALLERMHPLRRRHVEQCRRDGTPASAGLDEWVLTRLAQRVAATIEAPDIGASRRSSLASSLRGWRARFGGIRWLQS